MTPRATLAFDLGLDAHRKRDFATALNRFSEACEAAPDWHEARFALAHTFERLGRINDAFEAALDCVQTEAPSRAALIFFCNLLDSYAPPHGFDPRPDAFAPFFADSKLDARLPARLAMASMRVGGPLASALDIARNAGFAEAAVWALSQAGHTLLNHPIFLSALRAGPNTDAAVELLLRAIRREIALDPNYLETPSIAVFAEALAAQCKLNEFVFFAAPDEQWAANDPRVRALYVDDSAARGQVRARFSGVSGLVAGQYEENPYPAWHRINPPHRGAKTAEIAHALRRRGRAPMPPAPRVLIAGCGTGQQVAQYALGLDVHARIVACDLSEASLAYAERKMRENGIENVIFRCADILDLDHASEPFDLIACAGVLHHMDDPLQGWRTLTGLLAPAGIQFIALYSEAARRPLRDLRHRFPADGNLAMADRIRAFRYDVLEAHAFDWSASGMGWSDFFTLGGCRDLMFHARETAYTIARLRDELSALGLEFFEFALPPSMLAEFATMFPNESARYDLACWNEFERAHPAAFERMYQFWCAPKRQE